MGKKPVDGFSAQRADLFPALQRVSLARSKKDLVPILGAVLIEYGGGSVTLTCTDGEQSVTTSLQADTRGGGKVAVSCALLAEVVGGLPTDADVDVAATPSRSILRSGRAQVALPGLPVEEFPAFDPGVEGGTAIVDGALLADALGRANTLTVASMESADIPALGGVLLDLNGVARIVGTDRYRLLDASVAIEQGVRPLTGQFVLPKTAVALAKLLAGDKKVTLAGNRDRLVMTTLTTTIVTRLFGHQYPDTSRFFLTDVPARVSVDVAALVAAMQRVAAVADDKVRMEFGPSEIKLTCSTNHGEAEDSVVAESNVTEPIEMGINPRFLTTVLAAIAAPRVVFWPVNQDKPLRIHPADDKNAARSLVLPMRI